MDWVSGYEGENDDMYGKLRPTGMSRIMSSLERYVSLHEYHRAGNNDITALYNDNLIKNCLKNHLCTGLGRLIDIAERKKLGNFIYLHSYSSCHSGLPAKSRQIRRSRLFDPCLLNCPFYHTLRGLAASSLALVVAQDGLLYGPSLYELDPGPGSSSLPALIPNLDPPGTLDRLFLLPIAPNEIFSIPKIRPNTP